MKTCTTCQENKELTAFKKRKSGKLYTRCRACCYADDLVWRSKNKGRYKSGQLQAKYGISLEQYNEMLVTQGGCCASCKQDQSSFKIMLAVDHDHKTDRVRGLLCDACNKAVGYLRDNPTFADGIAAYLRSQ